MAPAATPGTDYGGGDVLSLRTFPRPVRSGSTVTTPVEQRRMIDKCVAFKAQVYTVKPTCTCSVTQGCSLHYTLYMYKDLVFSY